MVFKSDESTLFLKFCTEFLIINFSLQGNVLYLIPVGNHCHNEQLLLIGVNQIPPVCWGRRNLRTNALTYRLMHVRDKLPLETNVNICFSQNGELNIWTSLSAENNLKCINVLAQNKEYLDRTLIRNLVRGNLSAEAGFLPWRYLPN